ncbi:MAG: DNA primase [Clostridia bacterium]|nr:DNA primase [Clostridia bacterium]
MIISPEIIEDIKFRNNIETVISSYVNLKRAGSNFNGLCPFHSEKTPSFTVFPATQSFYCFGCGAGGDAITFTMRMENLDYLSAVKLLASRSGISLPEDSNITGKKEVGRQRIIDMNKDAARFFHSMLLDEKIGEPGREYIIDKRGLSMPIIKHFGIGYAPNSFASLHDHLKKLGYSDEEMITGFLCARSKKNNSVFDLFRDRVIFPIFDITGNVIAFGGRRLDGIKELKYLHTNDTPAFKKSKNLYALNFAKNHGSDSMILCEGYMDVIALHASGFENAVATLGTAITPEQARVFSRYTKKVIISYDNDEAGQRAADKAFRNLQDVGIDVRILKSDSTEAKDPDEYIKKHGKDRFLKLLNSSKSKFEFEMDRILLAHNINIMDERVKASKELCNAIAGYPAQVERELYARKVSKLLEVPPESILKDVDSILNKRRKQEKSNEKTEIFRQSSGIGDRVNPESSLNIKANKIEESILGLMLYKPELLKIGIDHLTVDDFVTSLCKRIFDSVSSTFKECGKYDIGYIQGDFTIDEISRIAKMVASRELLTNNNEDELMRLINSLSNEKNKNDIAGYDNILDIIKNKKS